MNSGPIYTVNQPPGYNAQPQFGVSYNQVAPSVRVYTSQPRLGFQPAQVMCPNCSANVLTELNFRSGALVYICAGGLCFLGLWLGCCLIPFAIDGLKDAEHYCPNCKALVGYHRRLN